MNPFKDEYLEQEVKFYGLTEPYKNNGVEVTHHRITGRVNDYFNKNFRVSKTPVPVLLIDKRLWMSLTYMELQSAYLPIQRAGGNVAVLGLGLGYFTLKVMELVNVDTVHVFEQDARIMEFFQQKFSHRDGFEKCVFHLGDARETFRGFNNIGYCWSDIYPTLTSDKMLTDMSYFKDQNSIECYDFWSQELILVSALVAGMKPYVHPDEKLFIKTWMETENEYNGQRYSPSGMYEGIEDDTEYLKHALKIMDRI